MLTIAYPALMLCFACAPVAAQELPVFDLIYDAADGSLAIDTHGEPLTGYGITAQPNTFDVSQFNLVGGAPLVPAASDSELWDDGIDGVSGIHMVGTVMQPGLTEAQFLSLIGPDSFLLDDDDNETTPVIQATVNRVYVPEPTTAIGFGSAALLLITRHRRA